MVSLPREPSGNTASCPIRCTLHRIIPEVCITLGGACAPVAEQRSHDEERLSARGWNRRERMPQVVKSNLVQPGSVSNGVPDTLDLLEVLAGFGTWQDEWVSVDPRNGLEQGGGTL